MAYAAQTRVPTSKTKTDSEALLAKHGATGFAYATEGVRSLVAFGISGRRVRNAQLGSKPAGNTGGRVPCHHRAARWRDSGRVISSSDRGSVRIG